MVNQLSKKSLCPILSCRCSYKQVTTCTHFWRWLYLSGTDVSVFPVYSKKPYMKLLLPALTKILNPHVLGFLGLHCPYFAHLRWNSLLVCRMIFFRCHFHTFVSNSFNHWSNFKKFIITIMCCSIINKM